MNRKSLYLGLVALALLAACAQTIMGPRLTRVHIIDRNGLSEIISNRERLNRYDSVDFSRPQPYEQVTRSYSPDETGHVHGQITAYYSNGQLKQSLDLVDGRANGWYQEWHSNGQLRVRCMVVGGTADLAPHAQASWLFDGLSEAWDQEGHLIGAILYDKGKLEGLSIQYHPNGQIAQQSTFHNGLIDGETNSYYPNGQLAHCAHYDQGVLHGLSTSYWPSGAIAATEDYVEGLIKEGRYHNPAGTIIAHILRGNGQRAIFQDSHLARLETYREGRQEGRIDTFDARGHLVSTHSTKNNLKHGEETIYYTPSLLDDSRHKQPKPKLSLHWIEGALQGQARSYYENGNLESSRELSQNKKNGLCSAYYRDGNLMLVEEYENGRLIKGTYYRPNESSPCSHIDQGKGIANLFDADGHLLRRVTYRNGSPIE
jgi:antitoxin component YwqK of YwqJK toxin-antitoxin module